MKVEQEEEFGALVARLRAAPVAHVAPDFAGRVRGAVHAAEVMRRWRRVGLFAAAASLVVAVGAGTLLSRTDSTVSSSALLAAQRMEGDFTVSSAAPYVQAFAVKALAADPAVPADSLTRAVAYLVRSQAADGGWGQVELSRRNAAALRSAADTGDAVARVAYHRARRYLRAHGLAELTGKELVESARAICARSRGAVNVDLLAPIALCAR